MSGTSPEPEPTLPSAARPTGGSPGDAGAPGSPLATPPASPLDLGVIARAIRPAIIFLTRVPLPPFEYRAEEWAWASAHFPLVGALTGALGGLVFVLLHPLGALAAALCALATTLLITGAFHEDGLADTADALGGAPTRSRIFEILKDSRIGSFGGAALALSIGLRAALIARLDGLTPVAAAATLAAVGALARLGPVFQIRFIPYVSGSPTAKSKDIARATNPQLVVAAFWSLLVVALSPAAWPRLPALLAMLGAVTFLTGWRYWARAGGITGDFLGATEQVAEVGLLAVLAWAA